MRMCICWWNTHSQTLVHLLQSLQLCLSSNLEQLKGDSQLRNREIDGDCTRTDTETPKLVISIVSFSFSCSFLVSCFGPVSARQQLKPRNFWVLAFFALLRLLLQLEHCCADCTLLFSSLKESTAAIIIVYPSCWLTDWHLHLRFSLSAFSIWLLLLLLLRHKNRKQPREPPPPFLLGLFSQPFFSLQFK